MGLHLVAWCCDPGKFQPIVVLGAAVCLVLTRTERYCTQSVVGARKSLEDIWQARLISDGLASHLL